MTLILNLQIYNTWLQRELGEAMRVATAACGIPNPNPYPNPNPDLDVKKEDAKRVVTKRKNLQ
jgi:hypothetical protein